MQTITVRQLNLFAKSLLEGNRQLCSVAVVGEITGLKNHYASGHSYFLLKDDFASIRCVMFRSYAQNCRELLKEGSKVVCFGRVSLYEKDGSYQLYVEACVPQGVGDAFGRLALLKKKLEQEGLFAAENKRPLARYPQKIAVITSAGGAALQDIIHVISRRYPICTLVVAVAGVQGDHAVSQLIFALDRVYARSDIDTIIIGRGGGSKEDLGAFNSEELARKIYESPIPVISAVGHQTDLSICDLVADCRAATPSAAAEMAVPDLADVMAKIRRLLLSSERALSGRMRAEEERFKRIASRTCFQNPEVFLQNYLQREKAAFEKVKNGWNKCWNEKAQNYAKTLIRIDALSPLKVLSRGYAVIQKDGRTVAHADELCVGEKICVRFSDSAANCRVIDVSAFQTGR